MIECPRDGEDIPTNLSDALTASPKASAFSLPDGVVALLLAWGSGLVYLLTLAPTVVAGNSGEYQYISALLSIPHSTGYPLYTLLGKLFTFLPLGTVAYRVNLLSAVAAMVAVALVYFLFRQLINSQTFAAAVALTFAFAANFWGSALIAEVHTLNVAFVALDTFLLLRWETRQRRLARPDIAWRELRWFVLAYGFSLTHHRITLLLAPAFAAFIALTLLARPISERDIADRWRRQKNPWLQVAVTFGLLLLPLLLYAYIPLRGQYYLSHSDPSVTAIYKDRAPEAILRGTVTAHYRQSWTGFINLVTGRDYAVDVGIDSWEQLRERLSLWIATLSEQFNTLGIVLGGIGIIALFRRDWRRAMLFLFSYASVTLFALFYVGHGQIWYYFMPTYVFWAGFMAVALDVIWRLVENRRDDPDSLPRQLKPYVLYSLLCFVAPIVLLQHNWHDVDMSSHYIDQYRAREVLSQNLEEGAVILGPWDLVTVVRYYQYAEEVRPDLVVVHADPAYSSGQKIIEKCVEIGRPLYLLDFLSPDVASSQLARWVRLTPLPYGGIPNVAGSAGQFDNQVALLGVKVQPSPVQHRPGTETFVNAQMFWRALVDVEQDYTVFVHLIAPDGSAMAQVDESPASVYYPTSKWQSGQTFVGEYWLAMPPQSPAGLYTLEVGLYDSTGDRLPVSSRGDDRMSSHGDSIIIRGLEVRVGD